MTDGRIGKVAIIDDDLAALQSLQFLLEVRGHIVAAYQSASAFLAAGDTKVACMIVDHHMPHMSGLELVGALRNAGVGCRIMLMTGASSAPIRDIAASLGVFKVVQKPPAEDELAEFVRGCARGQYTNGLKC
jgi:FixJ family two-component response regulator